MTKQICEWNNAPTAPAPLSGCTPLTGGQVLPGQPVWYRLKIDAPASGAQWTVTLTETYAPGFVAQSVTCVDQSGTQIYSASMPTATSLGPITIQSGQSAYCAMAGYFNVGASTATSATNAVSLSATNNLSQTGAGSAVINATIDTTAELPTDLSVSKTANMTSVPLGQQVTYTITISNPASGKAVFVGPFFRLVDSLQKFNSSIYLKATLVGLPTCSTTGGASCLKLQPYSTSLQLQVYSSTIWQAFAEWRFDTNDLSNPGLMPAGSSTSITYTVTYEAYVTCGSTNSGHGIRNQAYFDLNQVQPAANLTEQNAANNSVTAPDVAVTTNFSPCPPAPDLTVVKTIEPPGSLGTSSSNPLPWGSVVTYWITVTNPSTSVVTLNNLQLSDVIYSQAPTPPFQATVVSAICSGSVSCSGTSQAPQIIAQWAQLKNLWVGGSITLAPGQNIKLELKVRYDEISCTNVTNPNWIIVNNAQLTGPLFKMIPVSTYMATPTSCDFKVQKAFKGAEPAVLQFSDPNSNTPLTYGYNVTFKNNLNKTVTAFTLLDLLRIDQLNYANKLPLTYRYSCTGLSAHPLGFTNTSYPSYFTSPTGVAYAPQSTLGVALINIGAGGVTFGPGEVLSCDLDVRIERPDVGDPNCMGSGLAKIQNLAMLETTANYNLNLGPPTNPNLWSEKSTPLPRCFNLQVNKIVTPGSATTTGPTLSYTIEVINYGDDDIVGLTSPDWLELTDLFTGSYTPSSPTVTVSNPAGTGNEWQWITSPLSLAIKNLKKNQKIAITFLLAPPFSPPTVRNDATVVMKGAGANNWYSRNPDTLTTHLDVPITGPATEGGRICVRKFNDKDGDGVRDPGENLLSGWTFTIRDQNGNVAATGVTNSDGIFCTDAKLPAGTYTIEETVKPGWTNTTPGGSPPKVSTTITSGQTKTIEFGNCEGCKKGSSVLKVCKVAGEGVDVGEPFTFDANGTSVTAPAGPPPQGYCVVAGSYAEGSLVTVRETGADGYDVVKIDTAPADREISENLADKSVRVKMGPGVTEVTFTDTRTKGFIEICKAGEVRGDFHFKVPGYPTPITVPAGACSPALEVKAGTLTVSEIASAGSTMSGCDVYPASRKISCTNATLSATVTVAPGDISDMTILTFVNKPTTGPGPATGSPTGAHF